MPIDSLPYFLQLIRDNIILSTILTTGSFSNISLNDYKHESYTPNSMIIYNFLLGANDFFSEVVISIDNVDPIDTAVKVTHLSFITTDSKFFDNSFFYFGDEQRFAITTDSLKVNQRVRKKKFGFKQIFKEPYPPATVVIIKNPIYGYSIGLNFYSTHFFPDESPPK